MVENTQKVLTYLTVSLLVLGYIPLLGCSENGSASSSGDGAVGDQALPFPPGVDGFSLPDSDGIIGPLDMSIHCSYNQATIFVDSSVDGSKPCKPTADGTCVSGKVTFAEKTYTIENGDVGEVYLFVNADDPPILSYRAELKTNVMAFKLPTIPQAVTAACEDFQLSVRLDKGGNNKGNASGPEDIRLPIWQRTMLTLKAGEQKNDLELTL